MELSKHLPDEDVEWRSVIRARVKSDEMLEIR